MMEMPYIPEGLRILAAEGELDAFLSGVRAYGELCARMAREQERERIEASEVVQFLYGIESLDGVGFSEVPPGKPRYWWRSILRSTIKG